MNKTSILIVEDESIVAENLSHVLRQLGNEVAGIAVEGAEAVEMALHLQPQIILMDINLQGELDGIQATEAIQSQCDIPVVYLTAHSDPATLARAKLTGPSGYILKPFEPRDLQTQIELALHKHQTERLLRDQREWLQVTLNSIGDAVIAVDASGLVVFLNPVAEALTGWPAGEAVGQPSREVLRIFNAQAGIPPDAPPQVAIENGADMGLSDPTLLIRRDGKKVPIEESAAPIMDDKGRIQGTVLIFRDVTERRHIEIQRQKLQEQLNQAQKMESVGRLAGGVAHDFNNMLNIIIGHAELAEMTLEEENPDSSLFSDLKEIQTAAERSANLTRQLLAFARKQTIAPKVLDLNDTITDMIKMLRRLIGEDIDFAWLPGSGLWPVKIDPAQTDQLLANLCVNARDAIDGVGKITIETKNIIADNAYCNLHPECTPGQYVLLTVSDDGCGFDEETKKNLFEPFFTTKGVGQGTGLGLSTVYGIVKQNNGFIDVFSEPGQGAAFMIHFPKAIQGATAKIPTDASALVGGSERLLLVEDERAILGLAESVLKRLGYKVIAVPSPAEALSVAGSGTVAIDLLLTDVVMPEMNGRQLEEKIREHRPDLKVLFMTGYTSDDVANRGIFETEVPFLQKPFTVKSLAQKVREVLDSGNRQPPANSTAQDT